MGVVAQPADVVTPVPGELLADDTWLTARLAELTASWRIDSIRVAATLWWCMTASALVEPVIRALARGTAIAPPRPDRMALSLRPDGSVEAVRMLGADTPEPGEVAVALRATLRTVIDRLAAVSGVREAPLWAVVTDVIASWAVDARAPELGRRLAAELGPVVPAPRFVDIAGRTFVRRASCCLVYEAPGCEQCVSCPKRPPEEREALLGDYARRS